MARAKFRITLKAASRQQHVGRPQFDITIGVRGDDAFYAGSIAHDIESVSTAHDVAAGSLDLAGGAAKMLLHVDLVASPEQHLLRRPHLDLALAHPFEHSRIFVDDDGMQGGIAVVVPVHLGKRGRRPQIATGERGRAANLGRFLDDDDTCAGTCRARGGGHAGHPGADDDKVAIERLAPAQSASSPI